MSTLAQIAVSIFNHISDDRIDRDRKNRDHIDYDHNNRDYIDYDHNNWDYIDYDHNNRDHIDYDHFNRDYLEIHLPDESDYERIVPEAQLGEAVQKDEAVGKSRKFVWVKLETIKWNLQSCKKIGNYKFVIQWLLITGSNSS